ncbi:hypothetical protein Tco_1457532, partial [Tanacetum coccineum]
MKRALYNQCENPLTLQQLPFSLATKPGYPGRLVAGDAFPGRHVARDKSNGKARRGYVPERLTRATTPGPRGFRQTIKCHRGGAKKTGIIARDMDTQGKVTRPTMDSNSLFGSPLVKYVDLPKPLLKYIHINTQVMSNLLK